MKIKKVITQEQEVDVAFPYYAKNDNGHLKIISEDSAIEIYLPRTSSPSVYHWGNPLNDNFAGQLLEYNQESSEQEFNEVIRSFDIEWDNHIGAMIAKREEQRSKLNKLLESKEETTNIQVPDGQ